MRLQRHADPAAFLDRAGAFLLAREAEHNLILGLGARLRHDPAPYGEPAYLAVVERGGHVVAAALRTPPHNLVLSELDDEDALEPLALDAHDCFRALPGALGPRAPVERFARRWQALTGASARLALSERIYRARTARPPGGVAGRMRPYEDADRALVVAWLEAFAAEAMPAAPPEDAEAFLARRLAEPDGSLMLWEDGEPVSLAGFGGPTPNGVRVGPVYTPPDRRGRGYASALVAGLTQAQLDGGRRFCFLFTDLANPTSNAIYQRVGYEPVTDVDMWAFDSPG